MWVIVLRAETFAEPQPGRLMKYAASQSYRLPAMTTDPSCIFSKKRARLNFGGLHNGDIGDLACSMRVGRLPFCNCTSRENKTWTGTQWATILSSLLISTVPYSLPSRLRKSSPPTSDKKKPPVSQAYGDGINWSIHGA